MDNTLNISIANPRKHIEYVHWIRTPGSRDKLMIGLSSGKSIKVKIVNIKSDEDLPDAVGELSSVQQEVAKCLRQGIDIRADLLEPDGYGYLDVTIVK